MISDYAASITVFGCTICMTAITVFYLNSLTKLNRWPFYDREIVEGDGMTARNRRPGTWIYSLSFKHWFSWQVVHERDRSIRKKKYMSTCQVAFRKRSDNDGGGARMITYTLKELGYPEEPPRKLLPWIHMELRWSEKLNSTFKRRIKNVELSSTEVYTEHKYSVRKGFK